MRILTTFLSFILSFGLMAGTSVETLVDNYNYAMSVEWDQKDVIFHQAKTQELISELSKIQVSPQELMSLVEKKNPANLDLLKAKLSLMNLSSPEAISREILEMSPSLYSKGSSWNGAVVYSGGMLLILALVVFYTMNSKEQVCAGTSMGDHCELVGSDKVVCSYGEYCSKWKDKD